MRETPGTVEVIRKDIKHLYLRVLPPDGAVRVSAPLWMADGQIEAFLLSRGAWIEKQRARIREGQAHSRAGDTLYVWGAPYALRTRYGRSGLALSGNEAILTVRPGSTREQRETVVREWYRARLKEAIARSLPAWEARTGLRAGGWQVKRMRTRWGSCNTRTGKIWLNLSLAQKPPVCLDYVILHELAHLRVPHHGKAFTAILDQHMPDWRAVRNLLNG